MLQQYCYKYFVKHKKMYARLLIILVCFVAACSSPKYKNPHVKIETKFGDIELELYPAQAPKTVAAFLSYIDSGFYKNAAFYRVLRDDEQPSDAPKSELIQGGIWKTDYKLASIIPGIPHEPTNQTKILHTDGTISLARAAPGTGNTEFFICVGDQPGFNYGGANNPDGQGYAAFGKVVQGMNVVRKIYDAPETDGTFDPVIYIRKIKRL